MLVAWNSGAVSQFQLILGGSPGYSWFMSTPRSGGPYTIAAAQGFSPGATEAGGFSAGATAAGMFSSGATEAGGH